MRSRRVFTPTVDFMPSRISPSAAVVAPVAPVSPAGPALVNPPSLVITAMDTPTSYTIIAGEPIPPPTTINC